MFRARRQIINPVIALAGILAALWIVGYGYEASRLARDRHRPPLRWFVYGGVLGPLAIRILRLAPPGSCNTCLSPVVGWSIWCSYCGCDSRENWDRPATGRRQVPGADATLPPVGNQRPMGAPAGSNAPPIGAPTAAAGARSRGTASSPAGGNGTGRTAADPRPRPLASAVFVEGSVPLERGARYQLAVCGDDLRITGTAESLPGGQVLSRRLQEVQVTSTAERLLVAGITERLTDFRLVFDNVQTGVAPERSGEPVAQSPALDVDASVVSQ